MARFPAPFSTSEQVVSEPTAAPSFPLTIHSKAIVGAGFQSYVTERLSSLLKGLGSRVERVVVRFEDLNGPKGGVDTSCRIQLTLSGKPVLVVEARAEGEAHAFRLAAPRLGAALKRQLDRRHTKLPRASLRLQQIRAV